MIQYPFLEKGVTIGVTAPSSGVQVNHMNYYLLHLKV